jgi:hypothetical protein
VKKKKIEKLFFVKTKDTPFYQLLSKMSSSCDCPICMDEIKGKVNIVTTECGHCFHTNCLMACVAHNGFGCPFCRTKMAVEPEDEKESVWEDERDEEEEEEHEDHALRGFRFFFERVTGVQVTLTEDVEDEEIHIRFENEEEEEELPSPAFITKKLLDQGVTMEQLVTALLTSHDEYAENVEMYRTDGVIYGKIRVLISNYDGEEEEQEQEQVQVQVQEQEIVALEEKKTNLPFHFYEKRFLAVV